MNDEDQLEVVEGVGQPGSQTVGEKYGIGEVVKAPFDPNRLDQYQIREGQDRTEVIDPSGRVVAQRGGSGTFFIPEFDAGKVDYRFEERGPYRVAIDPQTDQGVAWVKGVGGGSGEFGKPNKEDLVSPESFERFVGQGIRFEGSNGRKIIGEEFLRDARQTLRQAVRKGELDEEQALDFLEIAEAKVTEHNKPFELAEREQRERAERERLARERLEREERDRREDEREARQRQEQETRERARVERERREREERERWEAEKEAEARRLAEEERKRARQWRGEVHLPFIAERADEVKIAVEASLADFELGTALRNSEEFKDELKEYSRRSLIALEVARTETSLGSEDFIEIRTYLAARLYSIAAERFLSQYRFGEYVGCLEALANPQNFEKYMDALYQSEEGLVALAAHKLESRPEYFNPVGAIDPLTGRMVGPNDGEAQKRIKEGVKSDIIDSLTRNRLRTGIDAKNISSAQSGRDLEAMFESSEAHVDLTQAEQIRVKANRSFTQAERLLVIFGSTSELGGPLIEMADGSYTLLEAEVWRRMEVKARARGLIDYDYNTQLAIDAVTRERVFDQGVSVEEALRQLEARRQLYYDTVAEVRAEYQGRITSGVGGHFLLKQLFYLPEATIPGSVESRELLRFAELQMRSLLSELGAFSLGEFMRRLKAKVSVPGREDTGRLITGLNVHQWVGKLRKADEQRNRFAGGKVGNETYEGFLNQPLANAEIAKSAQKGFDRSWFGLLRGHISGKPFGGLGGMDKTEKEEFIRRVLPMFGNFLAVVDGYRNYLAGRAPDGIAADYASRRLFEVFTGWLQGSEFRAVLNYPEEARMDNIPAALREILSRSPYLMRQLKIGRESATSPINEQDRTDILERAIWDVSERSF